MRIFKRIFICFLSACLLFCCAGCKKEPLKANAVNLSENIKPLKVKRQKIDDSFLLAQGDFALNLFKTEAKKHNENLNISPYSLSFALSMVAGGAEGQTLSEFERTLMRGIKRDRWNGNMHSLLKQIDSSIMQADSLWLENNGKNINQAFIESTAGYFDASVHYINFEADDAADELNNWVNQSTRGRIKSIADDFTPNTRIFLANTVYLNTSWSSTHSEKAVKQEAFNCADGTQSTVKMMYTVLKNSKNYLSDNQCEGYIKNCAGNYRFVALMPKDGVNIKDFIASLNAEKLKALAENAQSKKIKAGMPCFNIESSINFMESLKEMGIKSAYNESLADFSSIRDDKSLFMGNTLQKTVINVDLEGVRASAATGQEIVMMSPVPTEEITVVLNRPFVYAVLNEFNLPVFVGMVTQL